MNHKLRKTVSKKKEPAAPSNQRRFVITGGGPGAGADFFVDKDATEDQISSAAFDCVAEYLSFGWEEVEDE